jgi:MFS family permease
VLFSCISAGGSLLFFSSQVYSGVFLKSVVKLDPQLTGTLVISATILLFPLTLLCGWLSDRIGRRPILLAGLLLGALSIMPVFHGLLHYGNPSLERFNREVPIVLSGENCHYDPFTSASNDCERNQDFLTKLGVSYRLIPAAETAIRVGDQAVISAYQPERVKEALLAAGWSDKANPAEVNSLMIILLLIIPVVAVALITGPQTATLAELFPARMRYTAVALPHNLAAGWIGGLSPFMVTLISVQCGESLAGLWYPVGLLGVAFLIGALFLPETRNAALEV